MAKEWEPKEEHEAVIARSIEFISDELAELQAVSYTHLTLPTKA